MILGWDGQQEISERGEDAGWRGRGIGEWGVGNGEWGLRKSPERCVLGPFDAGKLELVRLKPDLLAKS